MSIRPDGSWTAIQSSPACRYLPSKPTTSSLCSFNGGRANRASGSREAPSPPPIEHCYGKREGLPSRMTSGSSSSTIDGGVWKEGSDRKQHSNVHYDRERGRYYGGGEITSFGLKNPRRQETSNRSTNESNSQTVSNNHGRRPLPLHPRNSARLRVAVLCCKSGRLN